MRVFIFIVDGRAKMVRVSCMSSVLKLQQFMMTRKSTPSVEIIFESTHDDMFSRLRTMTFDDDDYVVSVVSTYSANPEFFMTPLEEGIDFIVAPYARDGVLDWGSIAEAKKRGVCSSELMRNGITLNFSADKQPCYAGKYIKTNAESETLCHVIKFRASYFEHVERHVRNFATKKSVWLDTSASSKTSIQYAFTGCVGNQLLKKFL